MKYKMNYIFTLIGDDKLKGRQYEINTILFPFHEIESLLEYQIVQSYAAIGYHFVRPFYYKQRVINLKYQAVQNHLLNSILYLDKYVTDNSDIKENDYLYNSYLSSSSIYLHAALENLYQLVSFSLLDEENNKLLFDDDYYRYSKEADFRIKKFHKRYKGNDLVKQLKHLYFSKEVIYLRDHNNYIKHNGSVEYEKTDDIPIGMVNINTGMSEFKKEKISKLRYFDEIDTINNLYVAQSNLLLLLKIVMDSSIDETYRYLINISKALDSNVKSRNKLMEKNS